MITLKKKITATLSLVLFFGLSSCEKAASIYDLDQSGEIEEVKKEIIEAAGDLMTFQLTLRSQTELETALGNIEIVTNEGAAEGTLNRNTYDLIGTTPPGVAVIDSEFSVRVFSKNEPKKISELDFTLIEKNIAEAKAQIPSEFIDHSIYEYIIDFEENKRADTFTINCLKEGESDHMEGRDMVTNFYEFLFELDENGAVVMITD